MSPADWPLLIYADLPGSIAAIEAEARAALLAELEAGVEGLPSLIGWVTWDESLHPSAPAYIDRAAVLDLIRKAGGK